VTREGHARFWERPEVQFLRATRHDMISAMSSSVIPSKCSIFFRRRPMLPPAREIGDARHVGESDNAAIRGADAGLALSLEGRACHLTLCM
jgi:hypothetical protein